MNKFKISKRLKVLMDQTKFIDFVIKSIADIGTDHGYLPYLMMSNDLAQKSILCDINKGPLDNAKQTFSNASFSSNVEFRLGSGIEPLQPNEVDLVFIAGMGGGLIIDILNKDVDKARSFPFFILQPMTEQEALRKWLNANSFHVLWDHFIVDAGKHYEIIIITTLTDVKIKDEAVTVEENDAEFGTKYLMSQKPHYAKFLDHKEKKYTTIRDKIIKESQNKNSEKLELCENKLRIIHQIKGRLS